MTRKFECLHNLGAYLHDLDYADLPHPNSTPFDIRNILGANGLTGRPNAIVVSPELLAAISGDATGQTMFAPTINPSVVEAGYLGDLADIPMFDMDKVEKPEPLMGHLPNMVHVFGDGTYRFFSVKLNGPVSTNLATSIANLLNYLKDRGEVGDRRECERLLARLDQECGIKPREVV